MSNAYILRVAEGVDLNSIGAIIQIDSACTRTGKSRDIVGGTGRKSSSAAA